MLERVDKAFRALAARDATSSAPSCLEQEIIQQGGLPDPGFAGDADHSQIAVSVIRKQLVQFLQLFRAPLRFVLPDGENLSTDGSRSAASSWRTASISLFREIGVPGRTSRASDPPGIDLMLEGVNGVLLGVRVAAYR